MSLPVNKNNFYYYQAYGLNIASELELPELLRFDSSTNNHNITAFKADIHIRAGEVPEHLNNAIHTTSNKQVNQHEFIFQMAGIARYYAQNGTSIIVSPCNNAEPGDIRLYLLGTVFGAALHQRNDFPFHCSAILLPQTLVHGQHSCQSQVIAFCGDSGAGKSTLLHSFAERGFQVLGDDVGVIRISKRKNAFYPGFPRVKLWQDTLEHFQIYSEPLIKDLMRSDKYHLKIEQAFHAKPAQLYAVIELHQGPAFKLTEQRGINALKILMRNTYRPGILRQMGKKQDHFKKCADLLKNTRVFQYQRPWSLSELDQSVDYLLQAFKQWT